MERKSCFKSNKSLKYRLYEPFAGRAQDGDGVEIRMSNASLKEQLQAVASQITPNFGKEKKGVGRRMEPINNKANSKANHKTVTSAKPKWLEYAQYGVELLRAYFPACFKAVGDVQPLKKGIKQDLVIRLSTLANVVTEDKACMVKSLAYYVNTAAYHKSVVEGAARIDLDGNSVGCVTAEEAKYSQEKHQTKLQAKQARSSASVVVKQE